MVATRWTDIDTAKARQLIASAASEAEFIAAIGRTKAASFSRVKYMDDPEYRSRNKSRGQKSKKKFGNHPAGIHVTTRGRSVPDHVMADAARRNAAPRTITQFLCGDPAPGQSAFDRRKSAEALA